jgi:mRNA-degrading endonuclease toxin of MazEF toxin-antitoxin module
MTERRGEVWWGPAPHKSSPAYRPWLVLSGRNHPFADVECIVVAMTTQRHSQGIEVPESGWVRGGSEKDAYISPWYVATLKLSDLDNQQGELRSSLVDTAIEELRSYVPLHDS